MANSELMQTTTREERQLAEAYALADNVLMKKYLPDLGQYEIVPIDSQLSTQNLNNMARFYHIDRLIYDKEENNQEKLLNVYNALYTCGGSVILLIKSNGEKADFYIGTKAGEPSQLGTCKAVLEKALNGNFKGTQTSLLFGEKELNAMLGKVFEGDMKSIDRSVSAVTSVAGFREGHTMKSGDFVQGLEKLLETTHGEAFSLVIIAKPILPKELDYVRSAYEGLYSQLLPFAATEISYGKNESESVANSITEGVSTGVTTGKTTTKTNSESEGTTTSTSDTTGTSDTKGSTWNGGLGAGLGAGLNAALTAAASAALTVGTGGLTGLLAKVTGTLTGSLSGTLGATLSTTLNANVGYARSTSHTESQSRTVGKSFSKNYTTSIGISSSLSESETKSRTFGQTITATDGTNVNYQTHIERRGVKTLLDRIEIQLKRIDECADLGMWESAAYVIADDAQTSQLVASNYRALIRGKNSGIESSAITVWKAGTVEPTFPRRANRQSSVLDYLKKMEHPLLRESKFSPICVTPAAVISGEELTVAAGLPQQSLPGLPVDNIAKFGREVIYQAKTSARTLPFGKIQHMGQIEKSDVKLDIDLLTSHTFVTGSTGAGKSNAVYKLLQELRLRKIPWLVIEPAKGEYKDVFGGMADVSVYGTNPYKVPNLLQINPFGFPDDVHVLEHVDRLVEIFNACWPMYAAMPTILRESIERAYEACGWSLKFSRNPGQFPTFETLLNVLPQVIDSSAYSADTGSDYKGALVTRVRSLTRGIHGMIFGGDTDMQKLLTEPSIIDLSRVGSQETKSLIMGVLILKLQEFRMSEDTGANSGLRHVTVLEEAHNLLRKTSSEQSQEGSNLQGQSVAMISNAIAEMRTYGEGFVIADQSPTLMDMSVIRNTNTKIILRLPDESDRQLVGKATGLNDIQIEELSGLDMGVAAIFQSKWLEPVLCKIDKFDREKSFKDRYGDAIFKWQDSEGIAVRKFLNNALEVEHGEFSAEDIKEIRKWYGKLNLSETAMYIFENAIEGRPLEDSHKLILLNYAFDQLINNNPRRDDAIEAARHLLVGKLDLEAGDALIRRVTELFMRNLPERFELERPVKRVM